MARKRRRSTFNPFISLTDILFNLVLVLLFASAIFAQDIERKYAENISFQNRLAALQLERDTLFANVEGLTEELEDAREVEERLLDETLSLEEQIAGLVNNLDLAQARQQQLANRISLILGELGTADAERALLEEKITVILGDLDVAETEKKLLEEEVILMLGTLDEADEIARALREQVSELSRNNFLVVELEWLTESHDLDLHVTDPQGNRFFWQQPAYTATNSRLTLDNRIGARPNKPGLEIWTARELELGTYRIEVGLWGCGREREVDTYKPCQTDALASLLIRHRDGDELIGEIGIGADQSYALAESQTFVLTEAAADQLVLVAEVEVSEQDGQVSVEVKPANGLPLVKLAVSN